MKILRRKALHEQHYYQGWSDRRRGEENREHLAHAYEGHYREGWRDAAPLYPRVKR